MLILCFEVLQNVCIQLFPQTWDDSFCRVDKKLSVCPRNELSELFWTFEESVIFILSLEVKEEMHYPLGSRF